MLKKRLQQSVRYSKPYMSLEGYEEKIDHKEMKGFLNRINVELLPELGYISRVANDGLKYINNRDNSLRIVDDTRLESSYVENITPVLAFVCCGEIDSALTLLSLENRKEWLSKLFRFIEAVAVHTIQTTDDEWEKKNSELIGLAADVNGCAIGQLLHNAVKRSGSRLNNPDAEDLGYNNIYMRGTALIPYALGIDKDGIPHIDVFVVTRNEYDAVSMTKVFIDGAYNKELRFDTIAQHKDYLNIIQNLQATDVSKLKTVFKELAGCTDNANATLEVVRDSYSDTLDEIHRVKDAITNKFEGDEVKQKICRERYWHAERLLDVLACGYIEYLENVDRKVLDAYNAFLAYVN